MTNKEFVEFCTKNKITIGSVESFTGGLFASEITSVPGASKMFKGSLITYATEEKINLLYIESNVVEKYGVVSKEVALEMAEKGQKILNVDIAVSFTGNAGPDAMEDKPVGLIYIGIASRNKKQTFEHHLKGDRNSIQKQAIELAYEEIKKF